MSLLNSIEQELVALAKQYLNEQIGFKDFVEAVRRMRHGISPYDGCGRSDDGG